MAEVLASSTGEEAKLVEEDLDSSWEAIKGTPMYDKLRSKIMVLSPAQQKAALDYAVKCQKKAQGNKAAGSPEEAPKPGSSYSIVNVKKDKTKGGFTILTEKDVIDVEILDAVATGSVEKLHSLLVKFKRNAASEVIAKGEEEAHPLLHWAVLDDQVEIVDYLLDRLREMQKNNFNIDRKNLRGETALHWASLKGHPRSVHRLLENGADLTAADERGYSAIHHAAQFGHTRVIAQLLRWMARLNVGNIDLRDSCGRTALHWAAYKHFCQTVTFLISKGADLDAKDWEGCSPLHWAALQGDADVCQALLWEIKTPTKMVQYLEAKDKGGVNALQLADAKSEKFNKFSIEGEKFRHVISVLAKAHEVASKGVIPPKGFGGTTNPENVVYPENFWHGSWLGWPLFGIPLGFVYYLSIAPVTYIFAPKAVVATTCLYIALWWVWLYVQVKDPGFLVSEVVDDPSKKKRFFNYILPLVYPPRGYVAKNTIRAKTGETAELLEDGKDFNQKYEDEFPPSTQPSPKYKMAAYYRDLYYEILDKGLLVPVCTTCEIAKPLRSKHDRFTNKCVQRFDHYCPWVGAPVALENYGEFFAFCALVAVLVVVWIYDVYIFLEYSDESMTLQETLQTPANAAWYALLVLPTIPAFMYALAMCMQHCYLVSKNLTTNEMINRYRYKYIKIQPKAAVSTKFSQGMIKNWMEFFGLAEPVKVNFRQFFAQEFEGGKDTSNRIQGVVQAMKPGEDANNTEEPNLLSIIANSNITARDVGMSMMPKLKKKDN